MTDGCGDPSSVSPAEEQTEWTVERIDGDDPGMSVGGTVTFAKTVSDEDIRLFARSSGDTNRLHLDEDYAAESRFDGRIVHGALLSGHISAAIARLPGVPIILSQDAEFLAPAHPGEEVTAECEVVEDVGDRTYRLRTRLTDETDELLVDGEAVVLLDDGQEDDTEGGG